MSSQYIRNKSVVDLVADDYIALRKEAKLKRPLIKVDMPRIPLHDRKKAKFISEVSSLTFLLGRLDGDELNKLREVIGLLDDDDTFNKGLVEFRDLALSRPAMEIFYRLQRSPQNNGCKIRNILKRKR